MRSLSHTSVVARVALLGAVALASAGCAQTSRAGLSAPTSPFSAAAAGSVLRAISDRSPATVVDRTSSLALDRIDQRTASLDHTFRRQNTGYGVTVYVFDGGILETHPELEGRVRRGFSAFPDDNPVCNAHGTAVAGAIGGKTLGVAPEVELVDVKIVDCLKLRGTIEGIFRAAMWVLEDVQANPERPAVVNWSFMADTSGPIAALDSAVRALTAAGVPVIVSAGNVDLNACRISPANASGAFVVGSSTLRRTPTQSGYTSRDERTPGTAWGPCIDVFAPGDSVLLPSLDERNTPMTQLWQGTSMSAGYVSGAMALLLEANPRATPAQLYQHVRAVSTPRVIRESGSPFSRMLYVGTEGPVGPAPRVAVR